MALSGLWLIICLNSVVSGQVGKENAGNYLRQRWTTENGLPQNSVMAVEQTSDGYLWLGTFGGLARFDGIRFTVFDAGNTPGLKGNRIIALHKDRNDNLWIGSAHGGLSRYANGRFTTWTTRDGLPDDQVRGITEDRAGDIWVLTRRGLSRLTDGRFSTVLINDLSPGLGKWIIGATRDGSIWVSTSSGLIRYREGNLTTYKSIGGIPLTPAINIKETSDGSFWVASHYGLFRFRDEQFTAYATYDYRIKSEVPGYDQPLDNLVYFIYEDSGRTCFLTPAGISILEDGKIVPFQKIEGLRDLFRKGERVQCLIRDREGNLWIGNVGFGLSRFKVAPIVSYTAENGLSDLGFETIYGDVEGNLWMGGPLLYRRRGTEITSFAGLIDIRSIYRDRSGALWTGLQNGLYRFINGQITSVGMTRNMLPHMPIHTIFEDRAGQLWMGAETSPLATGGLFLFRNGDFIPFRTNDGLASNDVRIIAQDLDGALWIGTTNGLSRLKDGKFTSYTTANGLSHNSIREIHIEKDGALWIGTYGGGLNRFKDGRFVAITRNDGLFDNIVSRILTDDHGNFWMSCNRGIYRTNLKELNDFADGKIKAVNSVAYGIDDGMKSSETNGGNQPAGWRTDDGRLWFPTLRGVAVVDPKRFNSMPPPVIIERLLADASPLDVYAPAPVQPGNGDLEIQYTSLNLTAPEKARFRYRLEGYDENWIDAGTRRTAYYTGVPPGSYTFHVIAANGDGVWNETGARIEFRLLPHFYQTWWFYGLCALAAGFLAFGAYRLRVRQLVSRTAELETKVAERTGMIAEQSHKLELANEQLAHANIQLNQSNDDLLSTLNQLRLGVLITDRNGRVNFISETAETLLGHSKNDLAERDWSEALPLKATDLENLRSIVMLPQEQRTKLPVHLQGAGGRNYWMEIEALDDPRDPARRIFCLYDVSEIYDLRSLLADKAGFHDMIGDSPVMQIVYKQIQDVAQFESTVLIDGETGTGKELAARAIHYAGPRRTGPFIALNCAGLTESLVNSQLFGHKRGAFTGAVSDQIGVFEAANGGTLFLDEIGDIPASVQTSLLRVLQEREIARIGESKPRKIDVRVIAATHRDLNQEVSAGNFRQDLLYRIRVTRIHLPALRERLDDIPLLVAWFLSQSRTSNGTSAQEISQDAMERLMHYDWPGNIRELKSAVEAAIIHCTSGIIQYDDLPAEITHGAVHAASTPPLPATDQERIKLIQDALGKTYGNRAAAARLLGVSRSTLYNWLKELGLDRN
ncbi:MAG: sigma 54-interacting transcriptional regulator [Blastocatellales bacterium]